MSAAALTPAKKVGAFATDDYRDAIEAAALAELERLRRRSGGYLQFLGDFEREFSGDLEEMFQRLLGQSPALLVRIGDAVGQSATASRRRYVASVDLEVYAFSNNLRSHEARAGGDVASLDGTSDPGLRRMLADVRGILLGRDIGAGVRILGSWNETRQTSTAAGAVWLQTYVAQADVRPARIPAEGSRPTATSVQATSTIPTAVPPEATKVTTLTGDDA
jgi:hypothetical protein